MRVLLITDWLPETGGAEIYMGSVRDGLRAAGDEVRLLTSSAAPAAEGSADYRAYWSDRFAAKAVLQVMNPLAVATLRAALRGFRPDVALVNMFEHRLSPGILAPLRAVPTVLTVTDYKGVCPMGTKLLPSGRICTERAGLVCWRSGCVNLPHWLRDQPRYALIRSGRRHLARVLACSRWVQRELARDGVQAQHLTLPVPPPGPGFRRKPDPQPLLVYCGRLDGPKGIALLLRAFARLRVAVPAVRLRIVGRGPEGAALERLSQTLGLAEAVTFRGWVPPAEVERELADAWALVVPSLWGEPLGLVAIEAIVRGLPVVASAGGGLGELVQHGVTGLLFPNGDEDELVRQLLAVARAEPFPSHGLCPAVVADARAAHGVELHIERLRGIFSEIAG